MIKLYDNIIQNIINHYSLTNNKYIELLKKHAETIYEVNIQTLKTISRCPEIYYEKYFMFSLSLYFIDSVLDIGTDDEKSNLINSLFIAIDLFSDFKIWFANEFGDDELKNLEEYWLIQLQYQQLELNVNKEAYCKLFNGYSVNYWIKQCIMLYPLEVFAKKGYISISTDELITSLKTFYSILLEIDDYVDLSFDLKFGTLTPIQAIFYNKYGKSPQSALDLKPLQRKIDPNCLNLPKAYKEVLIRGISTYLK